VRGTLDTGSLPGLLRDFFVRRQTGHLHLIHSSDERMLVFRRGQIVRADRIDEGLVEQGVVDAEQLVLARKAALRERKSLATVLEERGIVAPGQLAEALATHVRLCITEAMSWKGARWDFEEQDPEAPFLEDMTLTVATGQILLECARQVTDPAEVERALGDLDRVLQLSTDPMLRFQQIPLTPDDGYALSRLDGVHSAAEVLQQMPLSREAGCRSLYALLCAGMIEFVESRSRAKAHAEPLRPLPPPEPVWTPPPPRVVPAPPPTAPPPVVHATPPSPAPSAATVPAPAAAPRASGEMSEKRREVILLHQQLPLKNHFEVLGIPQVATAAEVKEAYFKLAKRFHPDAHRDPALADLKDMLEAVFIRLGEAYEILRNPRTRSVYESDLTARTLTANNAARAQDEQAIAPAVDEALLAAQDVRKAEKLLLQEKFWDAIQLLEPAIHHLSGKMKVRGQVGLAQAYAKNPRWTRRAERVLYEVITEEPTNLEAQLLLARIYREGGLKARAVTVYRKVLDIAPENEEARNALVELIPDEPPPPPPGLFKKIFGGG
jgi:cytochrome c-type biogenesis protein CcmH/NrfG